MSRAAFDTLVMELKKDSGHGWSKEYREMQGSNLADRLMDYMESFKLLRSIYNGREIEIMPLAGKLIGEYPQEYGQENEEKQHGE